MAYCTRCSGEIGPMDVVCRHCRFNFPETSSPCIQPSLIESAVDDGAMFALVAWKYLPLGVLLVSTMLALLAIIGSQMALLTLLLRMCDKIYDLLH